MRHGHQPIQLAVPQPHLYANIFKSEAPRAHSHHVVFKPALGAVLKGIAQLDDHLRSKVHRASGRNVHRVDDRIYLANKGLGIVEKHGHCFVDLQPVFLGILYQHPVRFEVDLRHPGCHVKVRITVRRRTTEYGHARYTVRQQRTKAECVRTSSGPAEHRESIHPQVVEHLRNIAYVIPNRPGGKRVGKSEPRPVEGDVAEARVVTSCVSDQATSRRAMTVHNSGRRRVSVAPNCKTHVPAVSDLQPVGAKRPVQPAESTG